MTPYGTWELGVGASVYGVGASVYGVRACVYGVWASVYGSRVILVSAQGPNPSFFLFIRLLFDLGVCWDQDLDQGLTNIETGCMKPPEFNLI